jgi:glycosyltransferase involved in cell wall biosynthesis
MSLRLLAVHHGGGIGGAPVSMLKLLQHLPSDAVQAEALFTEAGPVTAYAAELGVPVEVVPTGGAFFYSAHARLGPRSVARFVRTFPAAVARAEATLRARRPDLLHLNTSVLLAWAAAARRTNTPVVWMVREVLGPQPVVRRWHAAYIERHARRVVGISDAVRACFPDPRRITRVYNVVDLAEFGALPLDASQQRQVKIELGLRGDEPVVMAIGSVQRVKGHWLLVDALARLDREVRLVLVTGGVAPAYRATWKGRLKAVLGRPLDSLDALTREAAARGLASQVVVTGYRRDIAHVLLAADVLAFPSLAPEGFGRPIIEAMALGRPVVATDIGPSAELLGPDAGVLVPPDADALAGALRALLDAPAERERRGRAGRQRVERCFRLETQVASMTAIYRAAVGSA